MARDQHFVTRERCSVVDDCPALLSFTRVDDGKQSQTILSSNLSLHNPVLFIVLGVSQKTHATMALFSPDLKVGNANWLATMFRDTSVPSLRSASCGEPARKTALVEQ